MKKDYNMAIEVRTLFDLAPPEIGKEFKADILEHKNIVDGKEFKKT